MAIGQLPTDSFGARSVNNDRLGFGCPWQGGQGRESDGLQTPHQGQMPLCTSGVTASKRYLVTRGPSNGSAHTDSQGRDAPPPSPSFARAHRCRHRTNHSPLKDGGSRSAVVRPRPTPGATSQSVGRSFSGSPIIWGARIESGRGKRLAILGAVTADFHPQHQPALPRARRVRGELRSIRLQSPLWPLPLIYPPTRDGTEPRAQRPRVQARSAAGRFHQHKA